MYACVEHYLYMTRVPMSYHSGKINIKCTSSGEISKIFKEKEESKEKLKNALPYASDIRY